MATEAERDQRWPRVDFRVGELAPALTARAGDQPLPQVAKRDLGRYYSILSRSLPPLSEGQWLMLCDVLNGTMLDETTARYLWAEVEDALRENPDLARQWDADGVALVERLRSLSFAEQMAVADAVERFLLTVPATDPHTELVKIGVIPE